MAPFRRIVDFAKADLRSYIPSRNRKPVAAQLSELARMARTRKYIPYHYFVLGLYDKNIPDDVTGYLPAKIMSKCMAEINPRESLEYANDKLLFRKIMSEKGIPAIAEILRIAPDGRILDSEDRLLSPEAALASLREHGPDIFVKPIVGSFGRGAFVPRPEDLDALISTARNVLVQPRLRQHPALQALYPHSVNTVRIDTLHTEAGWAHNAAVLRVGVGGSVIDNHGAGGIVVGIDLETGRLRPHGRQKPEASTDWYERHPDTGIAFAGITIPHWNMLRETVIRGAEALLPHGLTALGWDVAVLPEGVVLIEANCNWSSAAMQIGWGGIAETEIGRLARRHHGLDVSIPGADTGNRPQGSIVGSG